MPSFFPCKTLTQRVLFVQFLALGGLFFLHPPRRRPGTTLMIAFVRKFVFIFFSLFAFVSTSFFELLCYSCIFVDLFVYLFWCLELHGRAQFSPPTLELRWRGSISLAIHMIWWLRWLRPHLLSSLSNLQ